MAFFAIYRVLLLQIFHAFNSKVLMQKCRDKEVKEFFEKAVFLMV